MAFIFRRFCDTSIINLNTLEYSWTCFLKSCIQKVDMAGISFRVWSAKVSGHVKRKKNCNIIWTHPKVELVLLHVWSAAPGLKIKLYFFGWGGMVDYKRDRRACWTGDLWRGNRRWGAKLWAVWIHTCLMWTTTTVLFSNLWVWH